ARLGSGRTGPGGGGGRTAASGLGCLSRRRGRVGTVVCSCSARRGARENGADERRACGAGRSAGCGAYNGGAFLRGGTVSAERGADAAVSRPKSKVPSRRGPSAWGGQGPRKSEYR